jgi:hypothetical protein
MSGTQDQYLGVKPKLSESRHLSLFSGLSRTEAQRVLLRMEQDMVLPRSIGMPPDVSGRWLFELCQERDLDHASAVFPLCRETDEIGLGALEKLVGKPVHPWMPRQQRLPSQPRAFGSPAMPRAAGPVLSTGGFRGDQVVVSVAPNPKKLGSATHVRYAFWVPGDTIAQCMARGLTRADVLWDIDPSRHFVVLGTAEDAAKRREVEGA